ncbi:MAG: hypothetical protein ABI220_03315 [Candidatus Saccharimonadales bacterium]
MIQTNGEIYIKRPTGFILPGVLAFIIAATILAAAVLTVIMNNFFVVGNSVKSQQAFDIAEAGVNYYLWHMSHNNSDYKDGQSTPTTPDPILGYGPYVHNYIDSNAVKQGTYTLWIKPQGAGSTIVTVRSIGQVDGSDITRTVDAKIGAASFASYGLVSDTDFWFGSSETANGPVFSNAGVHMDGPNTDTVGSANATYQPSAGHYQSGEGGSHPGVWCSYTIPNCATRSKSNWLYPQPAVDFNQVSTSLCKMKVTAFADYATTSSYAGQANACTLVPTSRTNAYIPRRASSLSSTKGYLIQLNGNGTYDLYDVNGENDRNTPYTSALSLQSVGNGVSLPPSGVIFVEDNVWVLTKTGSSFTGRVTIASGRLSSGSQETNINIAGPVLYSSKDGSDVIGLVAENDVLLKPYAPPATGNFTFEVDAAALAQNGAVTYPNRYASNSSRCTRGWTGANQKLVFYGSVATRQEWTWNIYGGSCGDNARDYLTGYYWSGIEHTSTDYDYNLLYAPPPSYPVTGGYDILSWREVLTKP